MSFRMTDEEKTVAAIKVIGVGGGGGNAVNTMVQNRLRGVEFIAANTDVQALKTSQADICLQLGPGVTRGMGAGAEPEKGREAAEESVEQIQEVLRGADMVFVTAGLGGGTGTGGAPVIARCAREQGALTVAVVTKPFYFEARSRMKKAEKGWEELRKYADTIITIPNDRLLGLMQKNSTLIEMMHKVDEVLLRAVKGITDLINLPGHINVDFADLKTVMAEVGPAIMGTGVAVGENRAAEAARRAIDNQLLEEVGIDGARGVLINISATEESLTMAEFMEASALVQEKAHEDATVIIGALFDDSLDDELRVTVIATGLDQAEEGDVITEMEALRGRKAAARSPEGPDGGQAAERPAVGLRPAEPNSGARARSMPMPVFDNTVIDDLDKPAFLRKRAN